MATHSSVLAWKIPWTEEPGRLQSMGLLSRTQLSYYTFTFHFHALEKEMATHQYSCLENPRDRGAWWAAVCGVAQSRIQLTRLSSSSSRASYQEDIQYSLHIRVWLFVTLWTAACQAPVHGILQARILEWAAISSSSRSSPPRDRTHASCESCIDRFFTTTSTQKACIETLSRVWLFETPWTIRSMAFSRPEYWSGRPFPSPADLPNPRIELRSPALQAESLQLSHKERPRILEWVAYPFSSGSSQSRNLTGISCIAGRFFTNWAIREACRETHRRPTIRCFVAGLYSRANVHSKPELWH